MKLNKNISWKMHKGIGYFKIGERVIAVHDLDISLQEKYWNLLKTATLEDLKIQFNEDKTFNQYVSFIKMLGGFYDEKNKWTAFNKEYSLQLNKTDEIIMDMGIRIQGDKDLVSQVEKNLGNVFRIIDNNNDEEEKFAILIARKENMGELLNVSDSYIEKKIPFITILLKPFEAYIGPLTIPGETVCLRCVHKRENDNMMISKMQKDIYEIFNQNNEEEIPLVNMNSAISFAGTQILKYIFRLQRNQSPLKIANTIFEFQWLSDKISEHTVIKNIDCTACFPKWKMHSSEMWVSNKEGEN